MVSTAPTVIAVAEAQRIRLVTGRRPGDWMTDTGLWSLTNVAFDRCPARAALYSVPAMTYVIGKTCVDVTDKSCVQEYPVDCIYEGARAMYINPDECVDTPLIAALLPRKGW